MTEQLIELEAILLERERLWKLGTYFEGAYERSPNWSTADQEAWDENVAEMEVQDQRLRDLTKVLRAEYPTDFAAWVAERNRLRGEQLADPSVKKWQHELNPRTTERWNRYLIDDIPEIYTNVGW